MKKQVIIAAVALGAFVFGTHNAQAQVQATTAVNIILNDVISIDPGSVATGGAVDFNYVTAADYNSTKTVNVPNSLIVTSTKNFNVKVKAEGENFTDGTNNIPVNVLRIKATLAAGGNALSPVYTELSTSDKTLLGNIPLGSGVAIDLDYEIPEAKSSSSDILGKPAGTYTQNVTYTATAL